MRSITTAVLTFALLIVPIRTGAECAPWLSTTDPDMPGILVLTASLCIDWGIPLPGGFGITICEDCTCWYTGVVNGVYWSVNNNQTDCSLGGGNDGDGPVAVEN